MKLGTVSIPTPRIITKLPIPFKLASSSSSDGTKNLQHEPLLVTGELPDGTSRDSSSSFSSSRSSKVPKGSIAVHVWPHMRRFMVPISFLTMPEFTVLLEEVAEEYGCDHHGAIEIPCDEDHFERILMDCFSRQRILSSNNPKKLIGNMRRRRLIYV